MMRHDRRLDGSRIGSLGRVLVNTIVKLLFAVYLWREDDGCIGRARHRVARRGIDRWLDHGIVVLGGGRKSMSTS